MATAEKTTTEKYGGKYKTKNSPFNNSNISTSNQFTSPTPIQPNDNE
jgi:hypothetical protein